MCGRSWVFQSAAPAAHLVSTDTAGVLASVAGDTLPSPEPVQFRGRSHLKPASTRRLV